MKSPSKNPYLMAAPIPKFLKVIFSAINKMGTIIKKPRGQICHGAYDKEARTADDRRSKIFFFSLRKNSRKNPVILFFKMVIQNHFKKHFYEINSFKSNFVEAIRSFFKLS